MPHPRRPMKIASVSIGDRVHHATAIPSVDDVSGGLDQRDREVVEETQCFLKSLFGEQLYPILFLYSATGSLPISRTTSGGWQFRFRSLLFLYSACLYCVTLPLVVCMVKIMVELYYSAEDFDKRMYVQMATAILVPYCFIPCCSWWDAPRMAAYLNTWRQFQICYVQVTGTQLDLDVHKYVYYGTATIALGSVSTFISFSWFTSSCGSELISYVLNSMLNCSVLFIWLTTCAALGNAGDKLYTSFANAVNPTAAQKVAVLQDYRRLWLKLSELTRLSSHACYRSCLIPLALMFWCITIFLYGSISSLMEAQYQGFIINALLVESCLGPLLLICNHGYWVPIKIASKIQIELEHRNSLNSSAAEMYEVGEFLQVISMNSPVLTLGDFITVDRHMFQAACAAIVTYLIVVLQFRMTSTPDVDNKQNISSLVTFPS